jgi:DNA polymerase (family 10)
MYCRAPFRLWIGLSDIEKVLSACGKHGVAVEINAHPWRLDLDWRCHQAALGFGCMMGINPDAHSIPELDHMHWGVEMARKGGVPSNRVLNAMSLPQITRHLGDKRKRPAGRLTADLHRPRADED